MKIGDRVIWLGAKPGSWAGNGKGVIADYEPARRHFTGGAPVKPGEATVGPAVGILLDDGDPDCLKKHDVWVSPSSKEIVLDEDFVAKGAAA